MEFKDHFSARAVLSPNTARDIPMSFSPGYAGFVHRHELVWDCATGSGQAAVGLAKVFDRVIATDASEKQISMVAPHPSIEYRVATAYDSEIGDSSVDAVTVAQAIHWLDYDRFYSEARRVLRPGGLVAVWGYGDPILDDTRLHRIVHDYNRGTIESYWKPERDIILGGLRTIPFPFREVDPPSFTMEREWTLAELGGYMRTWSATAAFVEANGVDPVNDVELELAEHWEQGAVQHITWPLHVRAGYAA